MTIKSVETILIFEYNAIFCNEYALEDLISSTYVSGIHELFFKKGMNCILTIFYLNQLVCYLRHINTDILLSSKV